MEAVTGDLKKCKLLVITDRTNRAEVGITQEMEEHVWGPWVGKFPEVGNGNPL